MNALRKLSEGVLNPLGLATLLWRQFGKDSRVMSPPKATQSNSLRHIVIEAVTPTIDCARYPVKRISGESCVVEADIFGDGPTALAAVIKWRRAQDVSFAEAPMALIENDRWRGEFPLAENTRYVFAIEAWTRAFKSWNEYFMKKAASGLDAASDLTEGIALLENIGQRARAKDRTLIADYIARLRALENPGQAVAIVSAPELGAVVDRNEERSDAVNYDRTSAIVADRPRARSGAWYEIFPRSQGIQPGHHATLREAEARLPDISDMGFDVVYLTPIHPIGTTYRKGPNNSLIAAPDSPGSPWAIGSSAGGHMAIEPRLGTLDDFDHFVAVAERLGLEIALDFAIQCSPDHPWVTEHPEWFRHRPDGTIKYAENPPKQYQDIYPINFDSPDQKGLIEELRRVVLFWIEHGVKIFRVDNPHTKPVAFWEWLINTVREKHPEVIFLAEAFTRPKMMRVLAKAGFTQSYTYFTWRNTKAELTEYLTELTQTAMIDYFRPNFFTNTPDILPPILQDGGRPAFKSRLVLAATLSPSYGIYSGYELCENEAIPSTEEYDHSEKYEIKTRDWNRPDSLREFVARINAIRRGNAALQQFANLRFLTTDNDQIILYSKSSADRSNIILVAVNLDPHHPHHCTAFVPADVVGVAPGQGFAVTDLLTGARYNWGESNYIRLDPQIEPAHILRVESRP
jgi:starch synthase (maltosyl-transferring)